jgi:predicted RNA binding protein YcfA (HicA-like mRNA interferase family)
MAKIDKLIEKMLRLPTEMRFNEVTQVLEFFDWKLDNVAGSHYIYYKQNTILTVIKHKKKVVKVHLKRIVNALNLEEWYEENKK